MQAYLLTSCLSHFYLKHNSASAPMHIKNLATATKTTIQLPCSVMINIGKSQGLHQELQRACVRHSTHYHKKKITVLAWTRGQDRITASSVEFSWQGGRFVCTLSVIGMNTKEVNHISKNWNGKFRPCLWSLKWNIRMAPLLNSMWCKQSTWETLKFHLNCSS